MGLKQVDLATNTTAIVTSQAEAKWTKPCGIQGSNALNIDGVQLFRRRSNLGGHHGLQRLELEGVYGRRIR